MKRVIGLLFFLFSGGMGLMAQECDSTHWAQPGTYNVIIDPAAVDAGSVLNDTIMLSGDDLCLIESRRRPSQIVQIHIGAYLVTIYPIGETANQEIEE